MIHAGEEQYLNLVRRVWHGGAQRSDRTGTGTRALFGEMLKFDLSDGTVPLLTTKRVYWKSAIRELLWFLNGQSNIQPLVAQGVHIWTDWPLETYRRATNDPISREDFEARIVTDDDFAARWGDLGPVYGVQWRRWPRYAANADGSYRADTPHDQISELVHGLKTNPSSRRHIFTGWNVPELHRMALPPCHMTYQYFVADGRLSGILYQRSCDLGLGFPFNIFEAAVLIRMLAQQCGLEPGTLTWMGADCHLYLNHEHLVTEQLSRAPRPFPRLSLARQPDDLFSYALEDFVIDGYTPHPPIAAPVAV
ncbi:thymidylate synthase [Sandarakinorhabdus sp.]|uniref:thymidylate synthase n=1 Tax=Sandarakinorhabdus sp. TaxID=1916663 RepID=UPI00333EA4F3